MVIAGFLKNQQYVNFMEGNNKPLTTTYCYNIGPLGNKPSPSNKPGTSAASEDDMDNKAVSNAWQLAIEDVSKKSPTGPFVNGPREKPEYLIALVS